MKKIPSYPKLTPKNTNLTSTQAQNININSPKNLAFSSNNISSKKMFKSSSQNIHSINANKLSRQRQKQRQKSNNSYTKNVSNLNINNNSSSANNITSQKHTKSKKIYTTYQAQKNSKSTTQLLVKKQYPSNSSNNNLLKFSKNYDQQHSHNTVKKNQNQKYSTQNSINKKQQEHHHKNNGQIKKLSEKLKLLQKKIDGLKIKTSSSSKRKKEFPDSQRSKSKIKQNGSANRFNVSSVNNLNIQGKDNLAQFQKFKSSSNNDSSTKILKKSYSDKNMLKNRPPKIPTSKVYNNNKNKQQSHQMYYEDQVPQVQVKPSPQVHNRNSKKQKISQPHQQQQIIHKFVTQVQKNPKMVQKHHHVNSPQLANNKINYYVTHLSLSLKNNDYMIYKEHLVQSLHTLMYLHNNTRKPSLKELQKSSVNLKLNSKHKYTIVLDLDETLIHCNQSIDLPYDVILKIKFPTGQKIDAGVNIRPYAIRLLKQLSQFCQIIVFTASHQCYANVVLDHLDPHKKLISHRLYRNHCWQTQQGIYIKDLRILKNRDLQNVLLVDNAAYSYFYQLQNGIPIIPFYDDKQDEQLLHLIEYIKLLIKYKQVHKLHNTLKKANHNYFKLTEYVKFNDLQKLTKYLYEPVIKEIEEFHNSNYNNKGNSNNNNDY